jgi:hypothetical protein
MRRNVFDVLASAGGAVLVIVLLVAGSLSMWGYSFASSNVHSQLAQQQIVYLNQYAGQPLTAGAQAEAYADQGTTPRALLVEDYAYSESEFANRGEGGSCRTLTPAIRCRATLFIWT